MEQIIDITLLPLQDADREQFIIDNQRAFKYGAMEEFGMRDDHMEEGEEVISRKTIERSIDEEQAETYRIVCDGEVVGGGDSPHSIDGNNKLQEAYELGKNV